MNSCVIFISWSGKNSRSHKAAVLLRDWIPKVIQRQKCFLSTHDIEAGAQWTTQLFEKLDECHVGIICLTPSNRDRPWILFEAGALAKKLDKARVCPFLIGLEASAVDFPLAAFQMKTSTREDVFSLLEMINRTSVDDIEPLDMPTLQDAFEARWPEFEAKLQAIIKEKDDAKQATPAKDERAILTEIHSLVRGIASGTVAVAANISGSWPPLPITAENYSAMLRAPVNPVNLYRTAIQSFASSRAERLFDSLLTVGSTTLGPEAVELLEAIASFPKDLIRTSFGYALAVTVPKDAAGLINSLQPHVRKINAFATNWLQAVEKEDGAIDFRLVADVKLPRSSQSASAPPGSDVTPSSS